MLTRPSIRAWFRARLRFAAGFVALACAVFLAAGCWDRREINHLGMVACAAVDTVNDESAPEAGHDAIRSMRFRVTVEFFKPRAAGDREAGVATAGLARQVAVGVGTGYSVSAAIEELDLKMARHPYWAHAVCVILGEDLLEAGALETLDLCDRDPEIRRSMRVLMARGPAGEIVARAQGLLERTLAEEILGLSMIATRSGYGFVPSIHDLMLGLTGDTKSGFVPIVSLSPAPEPPQIGPAPAGQTPEAWRPVVTATARLEGAGLLYRGKLVGKLEPRETRGLMWATRKASGGIVNSACPVCGARVSVEVSRMDSRIGVDRSGDRLAGSVRIVMEGNLAEQGCEHDLTTASAISDLERRVSEAVRNEVAEAIAKTQRYGADVIGFGSALHRRNPRLWRTLRDRWRSEYASLPVKIEVIAKLRRTGLTLRPPAVQ